MSDEVKLVHPDGMPFVHPFPVISGTPVYRSDQQTLDQIRQIVQEEIAKSLHPEPALSSYDVTRFLQVECTDQDGQKWRGMMYAVEDA